MSYLDFNPAFEEGWYLAAQHCESGTRCIEQYSDDENLFHLGYQAYFSCKDAIQHIPQEKFSDVQVALRYYKENIEEISFNENCSIEKAQNSFVAGWDDYAIHSPSLSDDMINSAYELGKQAASETIECTPSARQLLQLQSEFAELFTALYRPQLR